MSAFSSNSLFTASSLQKKGTSYPNDNWSGRGWEEGDEGWDGIKNVRKDEDRILHRWRKMRKDMILVLSLT